MSTMSNPWSKKAVAATAARTVCLPSRGRHANAVKRATNQDPPRSGCLDSRVLAEAVSGVGGGGGGHFGKARESTSEQERA